MSGVLTSMVGINSGSNVTVLVGSDVNNFNARNALQSAGWDGSSKVNGTIIVDDGVTLFSTDDDKPSFDTGTALPEGSTLRLINRGLIVGKGGDSPFQARKPIAIANRAWRFEGVLDGWAALDQTTSAGTFENQPTLLISGGDSAPRFRSPSALGIAGGTHQFVRVRIRRTAITAGSWRGDCYYSTSGHGFGSYVKRISATLPVGVWTTLEWDMWNLTQGGNDWKNSNIIQIRLDFDNQYGDFEIDWITIGEITDWSPNHNVQGGKGGDAIHLSMPMIIDNTNGYIYSGGGSGGSVMVFDTTNGDKLLRWAGAGGGQGKDGGRGGITGTTDETGQTTSNHGGDGSLSMAGTGGVHASTTTDYGFTQIDAGGGGIWGEAGADASTSYVSGSETLLGVGGEPGLAIKTNGHEISWIGGNNETRVKGLIE